MSHRFARSTYGARGARLADWRDLLDIAACDTVDELIGVLEEYRADPPIPNEPVDS